MESIELLDGIIRVSPMALGIDIVLMIHFLYTYYVHCYKQGFKIDPWHWGLFISYFISTLLMYPLAGSELNSLFISQHLQKLQPLVDQAFYITICGYIFTYIGFYYFNFRLPDRNKDIIFLITNTLSRKLITVIYEIINSKIVIIILSVFLVVITILVTVGAIVKYGLSLNLRNDAMLDEIFRPIFNFVYSSSIPMISSFMLIRYLKYKERILVILYVLILIMTMISGMRGAILGPILGTVMLYAFYQRKKISLITIAIIGGSLLFTALFIGGMRSANSDLSTVLLNMGVSLFYGNNFSDVRDFAWILAYWDSEYILGKSYLAGFLSFIPRSISEFREVWSISIYTTQTLVGLSENHPGLRPGAFGEVYFNFGILGVILLGFIGGYIARYIDFKVKENIISENKDYSVGYAYTCITIFLSSFYISAAAWSVYVFLFILAFAYILVLFFKRFKIRW